MKAIVRAEGGARLQSIDQSVSLADDDVLVDVRAVAICRTDLYAAEGKIKVRQGRVLGHEFTGVVAEVGYAVSEFRPGDRVVGNPSFHCGDCRECHAGTPHRCADTTFLGLDHDGAFAEQVVVPSWSLHSLPERIPFDVGTFVEPVAAGIAVLEAGLNQQNRVWVNGSGRIAKLTGEILGDAGFSDFFVSETREISDGEVDGLIETCGLGGKMDALINALRPGGTLVLKSREPIHAELPILETIRKQIRIVAVKYGPFEDALDFVSRNVSTLQSYLDSSWTLDDFEESFEKAANCEEKKLCFRVSD
ncbi:MAG: alcohol dehydrogenase catalytic domain-containing protein [Verrucomicrobiota bacterium]